MNKDEIDKLLIDVGIDSFKTIDEEEIDGAYVLTYEDYDEFSNVYNALENSSKAKKNSPESFLNEKESHIQYETKNYRLELIGLFDDDDYTLTITKIGDIDN